MKIENAEYFIDPLTKEKISIMATIDGVKCGVPMDTANRHYVEILKQVEAGTLTIKDAD